MLPSHPVPSDRLRGTGGLSWQRKQCAKAVRWEPWCAQESQVPAMSVPGGWALCLWATWRWGCLGVGEAAQASLLPHPLLKVASYGASSQAPGAAKGLPWCSGNAKAAIGVLACELLGEGPCLGHGHVHSPR